MYTKYCRVEGVPVPAADPPTPKGFVGAGFVDRVVPGGPYAVYPIIEQVEESGAGTPAVLTMLTGYSLIDIDRVPSGLVFFTQGIVGVRLLAAATATVLAGVGLFAASTVLHAK